MRYQTAQTVWFISVFSAHGQAAVPLSAAWHSAALQLPAQVKAKSTLIFLVGPSVGKQGRWRHTREFSHRAHGTVIVSCRWRLLLLHPSARHTDVNHSTISNGDSRVTDGVATNALKCDCSLIVAGRGGCFTAVWMGGLGCHCGPFLPLQALISPSNSLSS